MNTVVFDNTRVITCDETHTVAEAIAIGAGKVLAVGGNRLLGGGVKVRCPRPFGGGGMVLLGNDLPCAAKRRS